MKNEYLATYLNDHLAGSTVAIELLEKMEHNATAARKSMIIELRSDIVADRKELIDRLGFRESVPRKAAAWFTEKFAQLKLAFDDKKAGPLWWLEAFETVSLGIEGKLALWRALGSAEDRPEFRQLDLAGLEKRAKSQRERAESARLEAARVALAKVAQ